MEWMSYSLLVLVQLVANRYVAMAARNGDKDKEECEGTVSSSYRRSPHAQRAAIPVLVRLIPKMATDHNYTLISMMVFLPVVSLLFVVFDHLYRLC